MTSIQAVLDAYFESWNDGFISKNADGIKSFMSKKFVGYWAHSNIDQPEFYTYDYDINGVLNHVKNAKKSFTAHSITERKNGGQIIVTGRETSLISGETFAAQCMFIWEKEEDQWKLLREYIELER
ncbi:nuclear transport factor 2 family protein [Falsibacillus pallidus]|uniref:nuclear transport factor 2 family protein n=1 Tax=Falsibacillus pallidus TaxID=493781 RepID=UPI003D965056